MSARRRPLPARTPRAAAEAPPRPSSRSIGRRAARARGGADAALPPARDRARRAARSTRSRCRRRSTSTRRGAAYDDATRERLVELFGAPERWGATTQSSSGRASTRWCPASPARRVHDRGPVHLRPRGRRGQVLLLAARRRGAAVASTSTARCSTPASDDRLQVVLVPVELHGALADAGRRVAARRSPRYYPGGGWVRLHDDTLDALSRRARPRAGCPRSTPCVRELLEED